MSQASSGRRRSTSLAPANAGVGSPDLVQCQRPAVGLEPAGRARRFTIVVAANKLAIHEDLRHGGPPGRLLQKLLDGPVARFADHVKLDDVEAQASNRAQHAQRVLRVRSVTLREDDGGVA